MKDSLSDAIARGLIAFSIIGAIIVICALLNGCHEIPYEEAYPEDCIAYEQQQEDEIACFPEMYIPNDVLEPFAVDKAASNLGCPNLGCGDCCHGGKRVRVTNKISMENQCHDHILDSNEKKPYIPGEIKTCCFHGNDCENCHSGLIGLSSGTDGCGMCHEDLDICFVNTLCDHNGPCFSCHKGEDFYSDTQACCINGDDCESCHSSVQRLFYHAGSNEPYPIQTTGRNLYNDIDMTTRADVASCYWATPAWGGSVWVPEPGQENPPVKR